MTGKPHITDPLDAWRRIKKNWIILTANKVVVGCVLVEILLAAFFWGKLPPKIPLWFSRPWGADQLASPFWIFLLPLSGIAVYFINLFISMYITAEYLIFSQVLFLSTVLYNILALVAVIKILTLVL